MGKINGSFVYLIHCVGTTYYKIGISYSPQKRLRDLQVANPLKLKLVAQIRHPDYTLLEQYLHVLCKNHKIRGEWFDFNDDEIKHIKPFFLRKGEGFDCVVASDIANKKKTSQEIFALGGWAVGVT